MKSMLRQALVALAATVITVGSALALDNVKFMIGANPGGGYDQTGRGLGKAMVEAGAAKSVQFENKGGAGGTIGLAQFVNSAKGDGNSDQVDERRGRHAQKRSRIGEVGRRFARLGRSHLSCPNRQKRRR